MTNSTSADDGATHHGRPGLPPVELPSATQPSAPARSLNIAVAVNPRAAFGGRRNNTTGQIGEVVVERLRAAGHQVSVLRRRNYAELEEAVRAALADGAQSLVVVGGDGMVHLGVNALAGTQVPLGIVPAGSGNDAARGLNLDPKDTGAAVEQFLKACQGLPRTIDLGRIERRGQAPVWFIGALSAGFDALVNERANGWRWPRGRQRYNLAILRELITLKALHYSLLVDGVARDIQALLISVSNGTSIGGGMLITPEAKYDDGQLDLFVVSPVPRRTFLRIFPLVFSGKHTSHPVVHIERVTEVAMTSPGLVGYADGERVGALPMTIRVDPGALRVWV
ncbi:diacylglycerol kinase family protein [Arthrobacter sp. GMC3]|uniref:diacylglycerol/lipid kinase family protein n=1 Tax=Arthrobacter sp. GMC3 TaxID=2058894 RepID=UPI000CE4E6A5|nr:diacylglycerol kinase family protein [Arthrobacter sp. GMC3]